jgi:hypothetical protein
MTILETERLVLRPPVEHDLDAIAALYGDPEVMRYIGSGEPIDRAESWKAIAGILGHWQLRGYGLFAFVERSTDTVIGRGGLYNPEGWPGLEVGWMLARDAQGKGYATEEEGRSPLVPASAHWRQPCARTWLHGTFAHTDPFAHTVRPADTPRSSRPWGCRCRAADVFRGGPCGEDTQLHELVRRPRRRVR